MPRPRSTKKLAQRIDLNYFKQANALYRTRVILSLVAPLLGLLCLSWYALAHNRHLYTSGPMSSAHAVLGLDCYACHVEEAGRFQRAAEDKACLSCHDGPIHQANQRFRPRCQDCHIEHQGRGMLAHTRDVACTQCHSHLETISGPSRFAAEITGFPSGHPEFAPLRKGFTDPGTIKLNHAVHMKRDLRGPDGRPLQLECADCHRTPAVIAPWRFGTAEFRRTPAPIKRDPLMAQRTRAYMAPVTYAQACATCHPLLFEARSDQVAPHDEPKVVHAFIVKWFREYIARHPEELRQPALQPLIPEKPLPVRVPGLSGEGWVAQRVNETERLLWQKTCKECHSLNLSPMQQLAANPLQPALPEVARAQITTVWLPHSVFDHHAHQMLACESCHTKALTSTETADVLLPGIATCAQCHRTGSDAAEARCFECHNYHDWTKQKEIRGRYTIPRQASVSANEQAPASPTTQ